ncbi:hypothetical protein NE237_017594 [Protea cynaroides]|uniref:Uncharacterized protein n=1 Tax=Protea cynaroides TaxID=273540 RepID=A0A9Q0QN57_9MAGN|nr:hypothetical protein NE237_017594 [Protea cynaroides]
MRKLENPPEANPMPEIDPIDDGLKLPDDNGNDDQRRESTGPFKHGLRLGFRLRLSSISFDHLLPKLTIRDRYSENQSTQPKPRWRNSQEFDPFVRALLGGIFWPFGSSFIFASFNLQR